LKKDSKKLNILLSKIPSVEKILQSKTLQPLIKKSSRKIMTQIIRKVISTEKKEAYANKKIYSTKERIDKIKEHAKRENLSFLTQVINGSGVILHTNLGRAPLGKEIYKVIRESLQGYTNLEYSLLKGNRGKRGESIEKLFCTLSQAEKSVIVNNNAGAIFLILNALAKNKEVIVSRGELVQIGGGFRIPEILKQSGAHLKEVGTTNQTFLDDYENAINEETALILKVHQSNFKISGFTHEVEIKELKSLGNKYNLPVIVDLGSGTFLNTENFGLIHEPTIQETVKTGADVICFSADKLLGGPQGGVICGKEIYLKKIAQHPLFRTLRVDKITITILQEILKYYLKNEATLKIPVWQMISCPFETISKRANYIIQELKAKNVPAFLKEGFSAIGGGSMPGQTLPTQLIYLKPPGSVDTFSRKLRFFEPPLLGRIENDYFILDPRCFDARHDKLTIKIIKNVFFEML